MLPPAPKDVGRLSTVFESARASVSGSGVNSLALKRVRHSVVLLIDGLGLENLEKAGANARYLNSFSKTSIRCEFPSTTATSIGGFATGVRSDQHGLIGYSVFDRISGSPINLLSGWSDSAAARAFKKQSAISEMGHELVYRSIGPAAYRESGFTELTMSGAEYVSADGIEERFLQAFGNFADKPSLTYLYVPELDQIAHRFGVDSNAWLIQLEEIDSLLRKHLVNLGDSVGVLLTADHGVLDVPSTNHFRLDELPQYSELVRYTAGDPRCNFVYAYNETHVASLKLVLQRELGNDALVVTPVELAEQGWCNWLSETAKSIAPDLVIIWMAKAVGYDHRFVKPHHLKMVGQHGGISDVETRVPIIKLSGY